MAETVVSIVLVLRFNMFFSVFKVIKDLIYFLIEGGVIVAVLLSMIPDFVLKRLPLGVRIGLNNNFFLYMSFFIAVILIFVMMVVMMMVVVIIVVIRVIIRRVVVGIAVRIVEMVSDILLVASVAVAYHIVVVVVVVIVVTVTVTMV